MQKLPKWLTTTVNVITAVATAALPALVDSGVMSAQVATFVGAVLAAIAGGHHTTNLAAVLAARKASQSPAS